MKNLFKIFIIAIILFIFSFSYTYAIDMFLTDYNSTTNIYEEDDENFSEKMNSDEFYNVEDEFYDENSVEDETLTTR